MKGPDRHEQPIPLAAEAIDRLLTVDLATRGVINVLYTAARRAQKDRPLCMVAAERLADVVKSGDTVVIATGLGDGGNELGLGLIRDEIRAAIPFGARCICPCGAGIAPEFAADVVVVATTSNWGAWGIEACLALLTGRREALHTEALERNVLRMCADQGAMDGITGFIEPDVDGIPGDICAHVVEMLGHIVTAALLSMTTQESVKMLREQRDR